MTRAINLAGPAKVDTGGSAEFSIDRFKAGLDEPDLDANLFKPYGMVDGFRAWFILQHLRGYIPFWTAIETESEIEGGLP